MKTYQYQWPLVALLFAVAFVARLLPYVAGFPWNFSPLFAVCLFGGACFRHRRWAMLLPLAVMLISDVGIGLITGHWEWAFNAGQLVVYGCLLLFVLLGLGLREHRPVWKLGVYGFTGCTLFFLITNFAVWAMGEGDMYARTLTGLAECYTMAIPFYRNSLLATAFFGAMLFNPLVLREVNSRPAQSESIMPTSV